VGIVQRQSLKNSIVNYLGIIIGGLSTMFIYPLDWELYGEIQFSLSSAILLSAFFSLGSHALVNKYFPYFESTKTKGFLSLLFIYSAINTVFISLLLFLFKAPFSSMLALGGFEVDKISDNLFIILPLGVLMVFIAVLRAHSFNFGRIVYPDIISNFSLKIIVPGIILLSYFSLINYNVAGWILVVYHIIIAIALMLYLKSLDGLDFKSGVLRRVKRKKHAEMIRYMLYGAMNHVGNILVYKIDIVMIGLLLSTTKVGYYSIFLFLSVVIEIPTKAVFQITGPMISKAFEDNKMDDIKKLYKTSSANLYVIGIVLFSLIWLNIETFFVVMTNGEDLVMYKTVFLLLALTKIIDMVTSVNFSIISYSKYFRVNTLFIFILAISNVIMNYYFINSFDIIGAALSTAISMLVFNLLKTFFVAIKYKMHPFTWPLIIISLFLLVAIFMPLFFPTLFKSILLSVLISGTFILLFIFVVYKLHISIEINRFIDKYRAKILK
jgi:O-antigen/teichoic acid export membrane protein